MPGMLRFGKDSHQVTQRSLSEICRDLRCTNSVLKMARPIDSFASHPALEGTLCGEGKVCTVQIHFISKCKSIIAMLKTSIAHDILYNLL